MSEEYSSAEEERRQRLRLNQSAGSASASSQRPAKKTRKTTEGLSTPVPFAAQPPPESYDDLQTSFQLPEQAVPQMKDMAQLLQDCQHLQQNVDGSPLCLEQLARMKPPPRETGRPSTIPIKAEPDEEEQKATTPAAASSSSVPIPDFSGVDDLTQALRMAILSKQPDSSSHWLDMEFKTRLAQLSVPEFYDETPSGLAGQASQEQLMEQLRRRQFTLLTQSAELESHLLAEAGAFQHRDGHVYDFPPCRNGQQCVGMKHFVRGQPRPFIFTMIMFESEFSYFIETGRGPRASRPCVQCARYHLAQCVVFDRAERMCGEGQPGDSVLNVKRSGNEIKQFYKNLCDEPGGYHRQHMLLNNTNPDDPILEPVCLPNHSVLFCVPSEVLFNRDTKQPRLVVDQSAIVWRDRTLPTPPVGSNLLSFFGGASKH